jgi:dipeptidase E
MKLMLTSAGIRNSSLAIALKRLIKKDKIKIAFIPTAANNKLGNKDWLIEDLYNCKKLGEVDIVDISALPIENWLPRLKWANVIFVGGGDTSYLMNWINKSGLVKELPSLLKNRVYVGISAGSIVTNPRLSASREFLYKDEPTRATKGLAFVDFYFRPHLNSPHFPKVRDEYLKEISKKLDATLYAGDDETAIVIDEGELKIVSEGKWIKYSKD